MLSIDQLLQGVTRAQARQMMVAILISCGIRADKWAKGGVGSSILTAAAAVFAMLSTQAQNLASNFFLTLAKSYGLQVLAQQMYGVTVPQATFASGNWLATNTSITNYTILDGQFGVQNTRTQQTYVNVGAITIPAGAINFPVPIRANVAGSIGNANPGDITGILTPLAGVTGSNAAPVVGLDQPSDAQIVQLCLNSLGARSVRGPRGAYLYSAATAINPTTNGPVNINRVDVSPASHTGTVTITVAGPDGTTATDDVTGVALSIEGSQGNPLTGARPDGITKIVQAANPVNYGPTIRTTVIAPNTISAATIQAAQAAAVTAFLQNYPISGRFAQDDSHPGGFQGLFGTGVLGAIAQATAQLSGCIYVSALGATDLALNSGDVAVDAVTILPPTILPS